MHGTGVSKYLHVLAGQLVLPWLLLFRLDTLKQSLFDAIQDRVMVDDRQVLRLCLKLLIGIGAWTKHVRSLRTHALHLLGHLTSSCTRVLV
jgi:hypothetical protein